MSNAHPAALAILWLGLVVCPLGCIGLPMSEEPKTADGIAVRALIGDASSDRPIRLGVTRRQDVIARLGEPRWRTQHDVALGYEYVVRSTHWFGPFVVETKAIFPFHYRYTPAWHCLFLRFDESDVLVGFSFRRHYGWIEKQTEELWRSFLSDVPDADDPSSRPPSPVFNAHD